MPEDGSKAQFQRHNPLPPHPTPLLLLAFSLCGCVWWQSLSRFQPFTFYFDSIWKKTRLTAHVNVLLWSRPHTKCHSPPTVQLTSAFYSFLNLPQTLLWCVPTDLSAVMNYLFKKKKKKKKNCSLKHTGSSERPEIILSASTGRIRRVLIILKTKLLLFTTWWQCNCGHLHFLTWLKQMSSAVKKKKKEKKEKKERKCWQRQSGESDLLEKYLKRDTQTVVCTVQMR